MAALTTLLDEFYNSKAMLTFNLAFDKKNNFKFQCCMVYSLLNVSHAKSSFTILIKTIS